MKKSLSPVNNNFYLFLCVFCLIKFCASGQDKVVIDKKPATTITRNRSVKAEKVKPGRSLQNKKQRKTQNRAFNNPSEDDRKLKAIKDEKSKLRNGK